MCQADGTTPLTNSSGGFLPDISQGGTVTIGENDFETIHTTGVGGSLQATETAALFGHQQSTRRSARSIDRATTDFQSSAELGTINSALQVSYSGLFVDTPENTPWTATPVSLNATNSYYGLFATDTFNVTDDLALTASGRYNLAQIDLTDRLGTALSGNNRYSRFNPALGLHRKNRRQPHRLCRLFGRQPRADAGGDRMFESDGAMPSAVEPVERSAESAPGRIAHLGSGLARPFLRQ